MAITVYLDSLLECFKMSNIRGYGHRSYLFNVNVKQITNFTEKKKENSSSAHENVSSSSSTIIALEFLQPSPLQSPHAGTQFSPNFLHVHRLVPHGLLVLFLHLHRRNFRRWSGATGWSVVIGESDPLSICQPQSVGSSAVVSSCCQTTSWRWTLMLWYFAALSVGGNFSGTRPQLAVDTMSWNFEHLWDWQERYRWESTDIIILAVSVSDRGSK